jgi:hypothetical protein
MRGDDTALKASGHPRDARIAGEPATIEAVIPAKAGIHIPEAGVWGTMGPRFRGDDSA